MNSLVFWCEFIDAVSFLGSCLCDPLPLSSCYCKPTISLNCGKYTVTKITKPERFRQKKCICQPFLQTGCQFFISIEIPTLSCIPEA